ncbi:MAG: glutathione binding-like protein [Gammaproteobacteria bacterium]|nr:glutathione binding-like protein [Gammaproteobacteria bacterium]
MIELYGSPTPSTHTIAIMLEEVQLPYSIFPVTKENTQQLELEFLKPTPNRIFPLILDREGPNGKPIVIFETNAILLYLAEKSGQLLPQETHEKYEVLQWLLFESSKIAPTLGNSKHFMYHAPEEVPYAVKRFNNETKRVFGILENQLSENEFISGDYSIADIATFPWIREYERYGFTSEQLPNISAWCNNMEERPAVIKGTNTLIGMKESV